MPIINKRGADILTPKLDPITIKLQMGLNKRMYDNKKISYAMFSKTNEILISRLTQAENYDSITLNEQTIMGVGVIP